MKKLLCFVFLIPCLLMSCDTLMHIKGTVVDKQTRLPLDSVRILYAIDWNDDSIFAYTDSLGQFKFGRKEVLLTPHFVTYLIGPRLHFLVLRDGYKSSLKKRYGYSNRPVTIRLERIKEK